MNKYKLEYWNSSGCFKEETAEWKCSENTYVFEHVDYYILATKITDNMEKQTQESTKQPIFKILEVSPPTYVGGYRLGKDKNYTVWINLTYKPNWLHRQCMRIFLGWYWEDKK